MMGATVIAVKENDVFRFRWNAAMAQKMIAPYHCFDGTLKATKDHNGAIILADTYWGRAFEGRWFTVEDALEKGTLKFVCSLDEVDPITKDDLQYFDDADVFVLYIHAGYRNEYYVRRGAERSQAKMLETVNQQVAGTEREIQFATQKLERLRSTKAEIEAGDTSVYL